MNVGASISIRPASISSLDSPLSSVNTGDIPVAGSASLSISSAAASTGAKSRPDGEVGRPNVTLYSPGKRFTKVYIPSAPVMISATGSPKISVTAPPAASVRLTVAPSTGVSLPF